MTETPETKKPDFRNGFPIRDLGDGSMISGQADGEELVLARRGDEALTLVVGSRNEISSRSGALEGNGRIGVGLRFT